ncbi:origin of replication binding protein-domain-containing protein [Dissophora ornata]|nr:origin of replication binding protein-domain-containing protein [Dissophora ornata]
MPKGRPSTQKGPPQQRAFAHADANHDDFFVGHNNKSRTGKTYCVYASYPDLPAFLQAYSSIPDEERCFNELIREGRECAEYYDVDWELNDDDKDGNPELAGLEQQVLASFLEARNQFAPEYPVLEEQCRVLSASSLGGAKKKVSLHIVISQYVFENNHEHMKAFMDNFKAARGGASDPVPTKYIDESVYTRNHGIRILGSSKRGDPSRKLVRADWHAASRDAHDSEFFITNVQPDSTRVGPIERSEKPGRKLVVSSKGEIGRIPVGEDAKLPQSVVDAVQVLVLKYQHASQFKFQYDGKGVLFRLQRVQAGHCDICKRTHDSDNAQLRLSETGYASFHCYRSPNAPGVTIGHLDFAQKIETVCAVLAQTTNAGTSLHADRTYSLKFVKHEYLAPPRQTPFRRKASEKQLPSLMIRSATGTGKTEFVRALIEANPGYKFVIVTCRRSLADTLATRLGGFTNYQDIKESRIACNKLIIQAESLHRLRHDYYGEKVILILDEFSSLCGQMTSSFTMGDNHDYNNQMLREFIKGVSRVICLDADLTNDDVQLVRRLRNDVLVIHNTFKPQEGDHVLMYETKSLLTLKVIDLLRRGNRIWISSTLSAERTEALHRQLQKEGFRGECVTSNSSPEDKRDYAKNINALLEDCDYFIHTPTYSVGIDYNVVGRVDYVVGFFCTRSQVDVETCRQMMRRVRHVKSKTYLVHVDQRTNNLPTTVEAVNDWISNQGYTLLSSKKEEGLKMSIEYGGGFSLPDTFYSQLWTNVRVKRNLSTNGFMRRFIHQMLDAGCSVRGEQGVVATDHPTIKSEKEMLEIVKNEQRVQIATADNLTTEAFDRLRAAPDVTLPERYAVSKRQLMDAYNIRDPSIVTPDWVAAYDNPREKQIYKNICALSVRNPCDLSMGTLQDGLANVHHWERLSLASAVENGPETIVLHKVDRSRYLRLKYAVDILVACGFTDLFSSDTVPAQALEDRIDLYWETVKDSEIRHMCTTLGMQMPTHGNWTFKNKKGFLSDTILHQVLGVKIVSANKRRTKYWLQHYSNVGLLREIPFEDQI